MLRANFHDESYCLSCLENLESRPDLFSLLFSDGLICQTCKNALEISEKRIKKDGRTFWILYEKNEFLAQKYMQYESGKDVALKDFFWLCLSDAFRFKLKSMPVFVLPVSEKEYFKQAAHPLKRIGQNLFSYVYEPFYVYKDEIHLKKHVFDLPECKNIFCKDENEYEACKPILEQFKIGNVILFMAEKSWLKSEKNHS
jgi:hypothetical protein